jgi:hypothetical protein
VQQLPKVTDWPKVILNVLALAIDLRLLNFKIGEQPSGG